MIQANHSWQQPISTCRYRLRGISRTFRSGRTASKEGASIPPLQALIILPLARIGRFTGRSKTSGGRCQFWTKAFQSAACASNCNLFPLSPGDAVIGEAIAGDTTYAPQAGYLAGYCSGHRQPLGIGWAIVVAPPHGVLVTRERRAARLGRLTSFTLLPCRHRPSSAVALSPLFARTSGRPERVSRRTPPSWLALRRRVPSGMGTDDGQEAVKSSWYGAHMLTVRLEACGLSPRQ